MDPELPKTLDAILSDKFDAATARSTAKKKAESAAAMQTAMTTVSAAYKKGDDATADAAMKDLVAKHPETAGIVLNVRFNRALDKGNEAKAHEIVRTDWEAADLEEGDLNELAWGLLTDKRIKNRDYPLAIAIATKGVEATKEQEPNVIDTLAYGLFLSGKIDEAIAWEQKAVTLTNGKDETLVASLEKYKKAKSQ